MRSHRRGLLLRSVTLGLVQVVASQTFAPPTLPPPPSPPPSPPPPSPPPSPPPPSPPLPQLTPPLAPPPLNATNNATWSNVSLYNETLDNATLVDAVLFDPGLKCTALPAWGFGVGVLMGVAGSIGINVGQNMQATALDELPEELKSKPHKSKLWMWGMVIFIVFSLINFAALALAPASILTPLESIQFVTNIFYNKFVNKAKISWAMQGGTWLTVLGTVFTVIFGPVGVPCHSVRTLENYWSRPTWLVYLIISLAIAIGSYVTHIVYTRKMKLVRVQTGEPEPWAHEMVLPVSFTLYSSLAGGAQMIVQSKVFSELLAMIFQGNLTIFTGWLLYVEIVLVVACGIIWIVKLTECLGLYNPLLILPLMVGTYILFGGVRAQLPATPPSPLSRPASHSFPPSPQPPISPRIACSADRTACPPRLRVASSSRSSSSWAHANLVRTRRARSGSRLAGSCTFLAWSSCWLGST